MVREYCFSTGIWCQRGADFTHYRFNMAPFYALNIRLSQAQHRIPEKLAEKLAISKTDVIRFALSRLADAEGVLKPNRSEEQRQV